MPTPRRTLLDRLIGLVRPDAKVGVIVNTTHGQVVVPVSAKKLPS